MRRQNILLLFELISSKNNNIYLLHIAFSLHILAEKFYLKTIKFNWNVTQNS